MFSGPRSVAGVLHAEPALLVAAHDLAAFGPPMITFVWLSNDAKEIVFYVCGAFLTGSAFVTAFIFALAHSDQLSIAYLRALAKRR